MALTKTAFLALTTQGLVTAERLGHRMQQDLSNEQVGLQTATTKELYDLIKQQSGDVNAKVQEISTMSYSIDENMQAGNRAYRYGIPFGPRGGGDDDQHYEMSVIPYLEGQALVVKAKLIESLYEVQKRINGFLPALPQALAGQPEALEGQLLARIQEIETPEPSQKMRLLKAQEVLGKEAEASGFAPTDERLKKMIADQAHQGGPMAFIVERSRGLLNPIAVDFDLRFAILGIKEQADGFTAISTQGMGLIDGLIEAINQGNPIGSVCVEGTSCAGGVPCECLKLINLLKAAKQGYKALESRQAGES